jgi:N-acetylmuramoyl-L-alanine amidase
MTKRLFLFAALLMMVVTMASAKFTLVIDAGHGGRDSGAKGKSAYEKNINLKVALAFGKYVEKNCPDVRVIYTRKTDEFISLAERAAIANRNKADLFISIHTNALPNGAVARGFEVYTLGMHRANDNLEVAKRENSVILVEKDYKTRYQGFDPKSSESYIMFEFIQDKYMAKSVELAKLVQSNVCKIANRPNKGVHQAGFLVLRETSMPSCLVELGFITTPDEEKLLVSESGIDAHARGLYQAFLKYKNKFAGGQAPFVEAVVEEQENPTTASTKEAIKEEPAKPESKEKEPATEKENEASGHAVFKVLILSVEQPLDDNDKRLQGLSNVAHFNENGRVNYTCGASEDYQEIFLLRKTLSEKFPNAYIVAFKNNRMIDVKQAIDEYTRGQ